MTLSQVTTLGRQIRRARQEAGFRNAESLAVEMGLGVRTIQRWEADDVAPSFPKLNRLAVIVGKPLAFFVTDEEEVPA